MIEELAFFNYENNINILEKFLGIVEAKYISETKRHLDVGHRKELKFPEFLAKKYPDSEIVYFDNRDFISRLTTTIKETLDTGKIIYPENIKFTSSPEPFFDSASYFFTLHEFGKEAKPAETIRQTYDLLREGGLLFIVDYNLAWIRNTENPKEAFIQIFNTETEMESLKKEGDCFEKHTFYFLEQCIEDSRGAGFEMLESNPSPGEKTKLFLYIGKK